MSWGWAMVFLGRGLILALVTLCAWGIRSSLSLTAREWAEMRAAVRRGEWVLGPEWGPRVLGLPCYLLIASGLFYVAFCFLSTFLGLESLLSPR